MNMLKQFASDMGKATKTATGGIGVWADGLSDNPQVRKRAAAARKQMAKNEVARKSAPKIPKSLTFEGHKYAIAGTYGSDLTTAKAYAKAMRDQNGFPTVVQKIKTSGITVYAVYYADPAKWKKVKAVTVTRTRAKRAIKAKKPRTSANW